MTKYILQSGGMVNNIPGAKKFIAEMVAGFGHQPKVLFSFFAQPREEWDQRFVEYTDGFKRWSPDGISPQFTLTLPETLEKQIAETDILYIHGGYDHLLQPIMKEFNLPEIWKGKVVATNSASTHMLSASYWTWTPRQCRDGFGILPIKTIGHFRATGNDTDPRGPIDWQAAYDELEEYGDTSLPIYALKEGEFEVFEVEDEQ